MSTKFETPDDLVEENSSEFNEDTVELALSILKVWDPSQSGKAPSGVAGTAVYVASMLTMEKVTQKQLKDVFNTSETTIRKNKGDALQTAREEGVF